jgi:hypothetical protein
MSRRRKSHWDGIGRFEEGVRLSICVFNFRRSIVVRSGKKRFPCLLAQLIGDFAHSEPVRLLRPTTQSENNRLVRKIRYALVHDLAHIFRGSVK